MRSRSSSTDSTLATSPGQQRHVAACVERRHRVAVLDEVAELGVAVVADGLVERDRVDRVAQHLDDLVERELGLGRQLGERRRAAERAFELRAHLEQRGEHVAGVHGQPDHARRVGDAALDRLADPPGRVRRELEALAPVELVDGVDEAEVALLHDVEQGQTRATGTSSRSRRRAAGSSSRTGGAPLRPGGSRGGAVRRCVGVSFFAVSSLVRAATPASMACARRISSSLVSRSWRPTSSR